MIEPDLPLEVRVYAFGSPPLLEHVDPLAGAAGALPCHADRVAALLEQPGVVDTTALRMSRPHNAQAAAWQRAARSLHDAESTKEQNALCSALATSGHDRVATWLERLALGVAQQPDGIVGEGGTLRIRPWRRDYETTKHIRTRVGLHAAAASLPNGAVMPDRSNGR